MESRSAANRQEPSEYEKSMGRLKFSTDRAVSLIRLDRIIKRLEAQK